MEIIRTLLKSETPLRWVFAGDSITHGCVWTFGYRTYPQLFEERLRSDLRRIKDSVISTGVSGWTSGNLKENLDWHVLQFQPDVVSIMIGMNDACRTGVEGVDAFEETYRNILATIRERTEAHLILHTTNTITTGIEPKREAAIPIYAERIRMIGKDLGIPVIDHETYWKVAWTEVPGRATMWMGDPIHPNEYGHRAFANLMYKELGMWDDSALSCKLFVP